MEIHAYPNVFHYTDRLKEDGSADSRPGWPTLVNNRATMLDNLDEAIRDGSYRPIDPRMKAQMRRFIVNARGRAEAGEGAHDDLVTARAIAGEVCKRPQTFGLAMVL